MAGAIGHPKDRADPGRAGLAAGAGTYPRRDSREMCDRMATLPFAPPLPVHGGLIPERLRTLAQRLDDRTYYYAPLARGRIRPGRLLSWRFDGELFPDLVGSAVVAVFKVESFSMTFPVASVV
jgi:hypothetical protein